MTSQGIMEQGIGARLAALREAANSDSAGAAKMAWAWIHEMRDLSKLDEDAADAHLNAMFGLGTPPADLDGPTEGTLVMTTMDDRLDKAIDFVWKMWRPWEGKRFDNVHDTGINHMTTGMSIVGKLVWPLYSMKEDPAGEKWAFDFNTFVEPSADDSSVNVMVIDYKDVPSNPNLLIRHIRDELVEMVPGVYLGKILYRHESGEHTKIGYFALRTPR